ncbi:DUF1963 domain-containing protein [Ruegeria sp. R14_0]|uniref:DUF1963 domain-containing protein n=1 Tax=Ruegeria sp. R14_0 TaxID=2821100 RepID=UPI001ADAD516|nr:DUF1963 domain-containing protein [Ruegeria sp. R14_0]MBO9447462.1 DUF1963 domain-containing protein [Ruegeria sp. R14_0]
MSSEVLGKIRSHLAYVQQAPLADWLIAGFHPSVETRVPYCISNRVWKMQRLYQLIQYVAPIVGLAGITMIIIGVQGAPRNWTLVQQSLPLVILALVFRPQRGHPMYDLMGMQGRSRRPAVKPEDTPEAKEAKAFLAEVMEQNLAVLAHEPGDLAHHTAPAKLVPLLPGAKERSRSWIGGAPMLPEDMEWPQVNSLPMLFVAQVALDELPEGIWGGLAPRDGWLAFFMPSEGRVDDDSRVFHLTGPVEPRDWPDVPHSFYFGTSGDKAREALAAVGFSVAPHPPRFPVAVQRHEGSTERRRSVEADDNQRFAIQEDYDPRSLIYRPFDTISARGFVASLLAGQHQALKILAGDIERTERNLQKSENAEDQAEMRKSLANDQQERATRDAAVAALEDVHSRLVARPDSLLDTGATDALIAELDQIEIRRPQRTDDGTKWISHSVIDEFWARSVSREVFEIQLQEAMRTHPERVSDSTRARYERLWRFDQEHQYATMGGPVHSGFIYSRARNPAFLLEVPSSDLVGWMFGDVASLGMFIDPSDMKAGRWDKAWGDILN